MKRIRRGVVVLSCAAGLSVPVGGADPAHAADGTLVDASIAMPDGVLHPGCHEYPYTLTATPASDSVSWLLTVSFTAPGGAEPFASATYTTADGTVVNDTVQVCNSDGLQAPGSYAVSVTGEWALPMPGGSITSGDIPPATDTASLTTPPTSTSLTAAATRVKVGRPTRLTLGSMWRDQAGWAPAVGSQMRLQRYRDGRWVTLWTGGHDDAGTTVRKVTYKGGRLILRAVTQAGTSPSVYSSSVSKKVVIRAKG